MMIAKHAAIKASKFAAVPKSLQRSVAETKVEYRRLGKSGLRVSNPIFGGLQVGSSDWLPWVLGEDKWDTANVYSNGESERIIGKALRTYNIPRRKVVLLTKCCRVVCDAEDFDVGSGVAMHSAEAARSKDYMNAWDPPLRRARAPEETMQALDSLVKAGKVRYLGASSMWTYQLALLQQAADKYGYTKFVSMQNHYNILYREEEREMNRYCDETGVGLIPWAPLASGQLARPWSQNGTSLRSTVNKNGELYHDEDVSASQAIVGRAEEIARRRGWPMSHVALAWLNRRVVAPIVGFSSVERLDEILQARGKLLTPEEERYLDEPYRPRWVLGHS
ncbi:aldo/keto reductase [Apiospora kogelbergensis]|uniref:aldo/keto reductase n=1 Tax=Apiospora kogelbergensis TaxID=1337665 RepID=UPI00312DF324